MNKFNIGDLVQHKKTPEIRGYVFSIYKRSSDNKIQYNIGDPPPRQLQLLGQVILEEDLVKIEKVKGIVYIFKAPVFPFPMSTTRKETLDIYVKGGGKLLQEIEFEYED